MSPETAYTAARSMSDDETPCIPLTDTSSGEGHMLRPNDPDSPMSWPLYKKIYVSAVASAFAFVVVYGTTTYTSAIAAIPDAYAVSSQIARLGFTMPFFGVFFAPIFTPHLSERYGRKPIYLASLPLFSLCVVVIGVTTKIQTLLAFRFLAGLFGGPCLVLIEGTFADVWSARKTVTYYAFLTLPSYLGAAFGPIIGGFVFTSKGPSWLAWVTLLFATFAMAFGAAMPETYGREILRTRIRYNKSNVKLPCAQSGVTILEMARITVFTPSKMLVSEPIVILITLCLGLNFGLVFQWFVSVPVALNGAYGFDVQQSGLAFFAAVGGVTLAVLSCSAIEAVTLRQKRHMSDIETRLFSAIVGILLNIGALVWVGLTAIPNTYHLVPIFGTGVYVWGNAMVLIALISYLFDAYTPAGTLSALTTAACFRIACAGIIPVFIVDIIEVLGGHWTFCMFAIITAVIGVGPVVLYFFGASWRMKSKYGGGMNTLMMEMDERVHGERDVGYET